MGKRVLVILTSCDKYTTADIATGYYLPEIAHPYKEMLDAGIQMDCISPKGGCAPVDKDSVEMFKEDPVCQWFLKDAAAQAAVTNTKKPSDVNPGDYDGVFYPGGHGPMFDLANDAGIAKMATQIYEKGGVVAAVCHGPASLVPVKLSNGEPIVKGKKVTGFTNTEEDAVQKSQYMPFMLETKLGELGGIFSKAGDWQEHCVVDGKLVTGQNPASSAAVGKAIVQLLK